MPQGSIFNPLFTSDQPYNYWQGIVAPRETWERDDELLDGRESVSNWGYRVKVRIEGVHPADKTEYPDIQLPWVQINLGSFGSGHKRTGGSVGITQGTHIWGMWIDPVTKSGPMHIGTIGNNDHLLLPRKQPDNNGFLPFSGFTATDIIAGYSIPNIQSKPYEGAFYPNLASLSDTTMMQEPAYALQSPTACEKVPMTSIQKSMQELIAKIERATNQLNTWQSAAQGWISEKQEWIQEQISVASEFVSLGLKDLFKNIRKFVEEEINKQTKKLYELINPPDRDKAKVAKDAIIELIVCLFNKMIGNLKGLVGNFLSKMLDRYINVPACAVQNFVGSLLGNTLGALSGAIDSIIGSLSSLIGGAFSLVNGILGILGQIAGFLACEEDQECPETKEWNIFEGSKPPTTFNIEGIISSAKSLAANAANLVDIDNIASIDFGELIDGAVNAANGCNVGPVFCGPPQVTFWGGGGSGGRGNAIVSAAGDLLGVDLIAPGIGYSKAPFVDISDNCGKGSGSRVRVEMEPDGGTGEGGVPTKRIRRVIIEDPGSGYLPGPNGDLGGDNRTWAPKDWTVIKRGDGKWEKYPPGTSNDIINPVTPGDGGDDDGGDGGGGGDSGSGGGDIIITPDDRNIIGGPSGGGVIITPGIYPGGSGGRSNSDGGGINGPGIGESNDERLGRLKGITKIPGTGLNGETDVNAFPTLNVGSYPVILVLCGIDIENSGVNYSDGDKVVIKPSNGAEVIPKFGPFGVLDSLKILKPGRGFVERPEIYIESETGYNAILNPILCVERIGDDTEGTIYGDDILKSVVSVVDCVGNIEGQSFVGFVNGQPYYGPFHTHMGRKMTGRTHESYQGRPHPYIYETASESLQYADQRFAWINGVLTQNMGQGSSTMSSQETSTSSTYGTTSRQSEQFSAPMMDTNSEQSSASAPESSTTSSAPSPSPSPAPPSAPSPAPPSAPPPSPPSAPPPSPPSAPPPSPPSGGGYGY